MNPQVQEFIQWAVDGAAALLLLYTRWVHGQIKDLERKAQGRIDDLALKVVQIQIDIAEFESTRAALERVENKLDALSELVHKMAGRQGIG